MLAAQVISQTKLVYYVDMLTFVVVSVDEWAFVHWPFVRLAFCPGASQYIQYRAIALKLYKITFSPPACAYSQSVTLKPVDSYRTQLNCQSAVNPIMTCGN